MPPVCVGREVRGSIPSRLVADVERRDGCSLEDKLVQYETGRVNIALWGEPPGEVLGCPIRVRVPRSLLVGVQAHVGRSVLAGEGGAEIADLQALFARDCRDQEVLGIDGAVHEAGVGHPSQAFEEVLDQAEALLQAAHLEAILLDELHQVALRELHDEQEAAAGPPATEELGEGPAGEELHDGGLPLGARPRDLLQVHLLHGDEALLAALGSHARPPHPAPYGVAADDLLRHQLPGEQGRDHGFALSHLLREEPRQGRRGRALEGQVGGLVEVADAHGRPGQAPAGQEPQHAAGDEGLRIESLRSRRRRLRCRERRRGRGGESGGARAD
mmetsp:Transcript_93742/g.270087  ORF Transcript_93742/g.270087 Transcript_93742/m.270087 type:complete len:330 (-) Transcript_93742:77-1066(-)